MPSGARKPLGEVIETLLSWRNADPEEQRQTLEMLMRNLDRFRFSERKLFP